MNPQDQKKVMGGIVAAVLGMYGSYLYGQKNPQRNLLDMPPKEMGQRAADRMDETKNYVKENTQPRK
eukprot:gene8602-9477_t